MKEMIYNFIEGQWGDNAPVMVTYKMWNSHILYTFQDYTLTSSGNIIEFIGDDCECQIDCGAVTDIQTVEDGIILFIGSDDVCVEISGVY